MVKYVIPVVIILLGIGFAKYQIDTRPKARQGKSESQARLVTVQTAQVSDITTTISAMGTVVAAKTTTLYPEVSGLVLSLGEEVIPGGLVNTGQRLVQIDSRDNEAIVAQRQSELTKAQLNLKLEYGSQTVARQEYQLLEEILTDQDQELVLRKPHLAEAQSAVQAAQAALDKARLDVERCVITSPFNAIIQQKHVDPGTRVSPSTPLLTLLGTDEYWIEVLVPVHQLRWITIPAENSHPGSHAKIYNTTAWREGVFREGTVLRLLGQLEDEGRMAQLLVSIRDPLTLSEDSSERPPVLIGSYVRVEIEGRNIESVIALKRDYLRDGDAVWIMNKQQELEIRPVEVVFRSKDMVYITQGIEVGEQIVTTDISAPVAGMPLRLDGNPENPEPTAGQNQLNSGPAGEHP
jgi:RND family efflux transporter MFP subunit